MNTPVLVEVAQFRPGVCFTCGGIKGPLIDTKAETVIGEHVYLCENVCFPQWDVLRGVLSKGDAETLTAERDELAARVDVLEAELEVERSPAAKVVTVEDAIELAKVISLDAKRTEKTAPKPRAAA